MTTTPTVGRIPSLGTWGPRPALIPGMSTFHRGVDIAVPVGTLVVAPQDGVVTVSTYNAVRGHYIVVDHGGGWSTSQQHMSRRDVTAGDRVAEGQRLGLSGNSGNVTGPHNHTEVRWQGTPIDPEPWYAARGVTLGAAHGSGGTAPTPTPVPEEDDMALTPAQESALAAIPTILATVQRIETKARRQDLLFLYFRTPDDRPAVAQPTELRYAVAPSDEVLEQHRWLMTQLGLVVDGTSVKEWDDVRTKTLGIAANGDVIVDPEAWGTQVPWDFYPGGRFDAATPTA